MNFGPLDDGVDAVAAAAIAARRESMRNVTPCACMGGWCAKRGACPHYHAEDRAEPVERLCTPGEDGNAVQWIQPKPGPAEAFSGAPEC